MTPDAADIPREPVRVPTLDELRSAVVSRPPAEESAPPDRPVASDKSASESDSGEDRLSPEAEFSLRHAATSMAGESLGAIFRAAGICSGSVQRRVLDELRARGFIRTESKGRGKTVHVYAAGYTYLHMEPPKGEGVGGPTHKRIVNELAKRFKARGCDVHVEQPIGPDRKRCDLLVLGKQRIAVELGLSDPEQEVKNITADLASGAVDFVLFVALDPSLLRRTVALLEKSPIYAENRHRVQWYLWPEKVTAAE